MRVMIAVCALMIMVSTAYAQEPEQFDVTGLFEFAQEYNADELVENTYKGALTGDTSAYEEVLSRLKELSFAPMREMCSLGYVLVPIAMLSALLSAVSVNTGGGCNAARFILRLNLLLGFSEIAGSAVHSIENCISAVEKLMECIGPVLSVMLAAGGLEGSAAMISPATLFAGSTASTIYRKLGMPVCRVALCCAVAGNLCEQIRLKRLLHLLKRWVTWGSGILITVFTALLALQGNICESLDGVAAQTVKYAVDSAAPVIGNGISEAWDGYMASVLVAKNALGVSGIAALLLSCAHPVLVCLYAMLMLNLTGAFLDMLGDKTGADAAEQIADVCKMALSISTSSMAIATVLLGAGMNMGRSFLS